MNVQKPGTSPHFVLAGVLVDSQRALDTCEAGLIEFRRERGISRAEFKFNKCADSVRRSYLSSAARLPWRYFAVVLDKAGLRMESAAPKEGLYKLAVSLLLDEASTHLSDAVVVFDSFGSREFRQTMSSYCKARSTRSDGSVGVKRVLAQASHSSHLLQLADMVAGAVARVHRAGGARDLEYQAAINAREQGLRRWP